MQCALCHRDRELRNSHVIPEFLHRPIYDNKHRTHLFGHGDRSTRLLQKGLRERLLCSECELRLQEFEDYFARYWYQTPPLPEPIPAGEIHLDNLDYRKLKLFLLSIIWRASVATVEGFESADLGRHERVIREMLLKGEPGPVEEYPIYAGLIIDPQSRQIWDQVIFAPVRIRAHGLWSYRLVFGGASWTIIISRHRTFPFPAFLLTKDGKLRLPSLSWEVFAREAGLIEATRNLKLRGN